MSESPQFVGIIHLVDDFNRLTLLLLFPCPLRKTPETLVPYPSSFFACFGFTFYIEKCIKQNTDRSTRFGCTLNIN